MLISKPAESAAILLNFFVSHRPQLLSIAIRILRCPHLAEDVVQDAAVKISQMRNETCIDSPERFARQIVRNLSIDYARKRKLERRSAAPEADGEAMPCPSIDPCARIEHCEAMRALAAALNELPPRTRYAFERARIAGTPQKSIAADLGVSPTLVTFMVQEAHDHCLIRLNEHTRGESDKALPREGGSHRRRGRRSIARRQGSSA
ncbi:sigma-70 family RNA polymerase sigma factor [Methylocapsa palsarum]|uniref:RNA polymerase sigma-70 factor, ECF subfamily n=1 Tax=Methylocapsa palsarum TaxID=1612308 RepID=A0A1I3W9R8_9HYPH|nr:RNA polymerase sigma-70 factor, ECF subfamily [Methylocapsa palsarum]